MIVPSALHPRLSDGVTQTKLSQHALTSRVRAGRLLEPFWKVVAESVLLLQAGVASPVKGAPAVPLAPGAPETGKSTVEEQVMALQAHGQPVHMGEHEEDGSYLEMLQSAMTNFSRDDSHIDPARRPNI